MKKNLKHFKFKYADSSRNRRLPLVAGLLLIFCALAPVFLGSSAHAVSYSLVTHRQIQMSDSNPGDVGVSYAVSFIPSATSEVLEGILVDFCSNDPIIGDTCTAPTGMSIGASPAVTTPTGFQGSPTWVYNKLSGGQTLTITDTSGATTSATSSTPITFTLSAVTNPTGSAGSFYARIITYTVVGSGGSPLSAYTATNINNSGAYTVQDAGGIALSTVQTVTITSKVQETLTFCIYSGSFDVSGNCSGTYTPVSLGNNNDVLSISGPFVDITTKYDIQTNASHGAIVNFTGTPLEDTNGDIIQNTSSSGTGSSAATGYPSSPGTQQFGMCSWSGSGGGATTTNLQIATTYSGNNTSGGQGTTCSSQTSQSAGTGSFGGAGTADFGFNTASAGGTYGDTLATSRQLGTLHKVV